MLLEFCSAAAFSMRSEGGRGLTLLGCSQHIQDLHAGTCTYGACVHEGGVTRTQFTQLWRQPLCSQVIRKFSRMPPRAGVAIQHKCVS